MPSSKESEVYVLEMVAGTKPNEMVVRTRPGFVTVRLSEHREVLHVTPETADALKETNRYRYAIPAEEATKQAIEGTRQAEQATLQEMEKTKRSIEITKRSAHSVWKAVGVFAVVIAGIVAMCIRPEAAVSIAAAVGVLAGIAGLPEIIERIKKKARVDNDE